MAKWISAKEQALQRKVANARTPSEKRTAAQQLVNRQIRNDKKWNQSKRWWQK